MATIKKTEGKYNVELNQDELEALLYALNKGSEAAWEAADRAEDKVRGRGASRTYAVNRAVAYEERARLVDVLAETFRQDRQAASQVAQALQSNHGWDASDAFYQLRTGKFDAQLADVEDNNYSWEAVADAAEFVDRYAS